MKILMIDMGCDGFFLSMGFCFNLWFVELFQGVNWSG
jgi:uncharacterized membrane protein